MILKKDNEKWKSVRQEFYCLASQTLFSSKIFVISKWLTEINGKDGPPTGIELLPSILIGLTIGKHETIATILPQVIPFYLNSVCGFDGIDLPIDGWKI